ncbi:MAG: hypothetical protein IT428_18965 [Planctomycetaceae bacterium]|nr:hypothetical protein [Planctomycetaceae bacterium]
MPATAHPPVPPPPTTAAAPKWAAVINDQLFPMPRRRLKARDIVAQAGMPGRTLIRDYNQPVDIELAPDEEVDLGDGNVFRLIESCQHPLHAAPAGAVAKVAFVADDAWEVTIAMNQTTESLRGLFGLPDDAELLRDFESPRDELLRPGEAVRFVDGPVFRIRPAVITVIVNTEHTVEFHKRVVTGLEFKQTAMAQGVKIDEQFALYRILPDGSLSPAIDDDERVVLKCGDQFRCLASHDDS